MNTYWWYKPYVLAPTVTLPFLGVGALLPTEWYTTAGTQKYLDLETFTIGFVALFCYSLAAWFSARSYSSSPRRHLEPHLQVNEHTYRKVMHLVLFVTTAAYLIWFGPLLNRPELVLSLLKGEQGAIYALKEYAEKTPGITSFTNLGPLYGVLYALYPTATGYERRPGDRLFFLGFMFLAVLRVLFSSERVALLEVVIPFAVIMLGTTYRHRIFINSLPFTAIGALSLLFGVSEYFRSWVNFYMYRYDSFWDFIFNRMFEYYVTALNNGAGMGKIVGPLFLPYFTASWFWKFPINIHSEGMPGLFRVDRLIYDGFLYTYADPEMNNPSGLFSPINDFGVFFGVVLWTAFGWIAGRLYHSFQYNSIYGLLFYPTCVVAIIEIPRLFYFGLSKTFPLLITTAMVCWFFRSATRRVG
ncbi:MAG: oligosaccharide repeat unit polymerase [Pseudomonadota bacterium]|nr:oligosaccharide repeat unit polymerase [Pseudomonadota bacterium]